MSYSFFFFFLEIYLNFSFAHATWRLLSTKCGQNFCCCFLVKRKHSVEFAKKRLENLQKNARHGWKSLIEELVRIAKGVINQTASSRVMTFSTGFCPGSWCAYFVYITSCITQKGISSASRKILRKRSIHETAKTRKFALGKNKRKLMSKKLKLGFSYFLAFFAHFFFPNELLDFLLSNVNSFSPLKIDFPQ